MKAKISIKFILLLFIMFLNILSAKKMDTKELELIQQKNYKVNIGQNLKVKTDLGDIIIKSWDKNEVEIQIYGNKNAESKMEFSFNQNENTVEVIGEKEGGKIFGWFNKIELKYEIKVPKKFNLDLKTSGGDMMAKVVEGNFEFKTSGGDIFIENSKGKINATTSGGDVVVNEFTGNTITETSGGDIEITKTFGNVYAATSGGDVVIKSSEGEIEAKTSGGDISLDYSGKDADISLSTSGGDIDVNIPKNLNANAEIKTSGGRIYNNFQNINNSTITKSKIEGNFNKGGKKLVCRTSGGDIRITQK